MEPSARRSKQPAYFIAELAHVVAMCDERLPFVTLANEVFFLCVLFLIFIYISSAIYESKGHFFFSFYALAYLFSIQGRVSVNSSWDIQILSGHIF